MPYKRSTRPCNQSTNPYKKIKDATMVNAQEIAKLEEQVGHLVAKFNKIEEEEVQSQLTAKGYYMIGEDDTSNSCHEHAQVTTTLGSRGNC
jgi:hypothetical protein